MIPSIQLSGKGKIKDGKMERREGLTKCSTGDILGWRNYYVSYFNDTTLHIRHNRTL